MNERKKAEYEQSRNFLAQVDFQKNFNVLNYTHIDVQYDIPNRLHFNLIFVYLSEDFD
jgi:hypothetical protein